MPLSAAVQGNSPSATSAAAPSTAQIPSGSRHGRIMTPLVASMAIPHVALALSAEKLTFQLRASSSSIRTLRRETEWRGILDGRTARDILFAILNLGLRGFRHRKLEHEHA